MAMSEFDTVSEFIELAQRATRMDHLERETEAVIKELGLDYFAVLHHLDLAAPGADPGPGAVRMSNYPSAWREEIQKRRLVSVDPALLASQRTAHGFYWSQMPCMIALNDRNKEVISLASAAGLGEGYTVPVHVPGELIGSSSFCVRQGRTFRAQSAPMLHYIGSFVFEAGRKIAARRASQANEPARLSERQLDCVVLAGQGQSARQAAQLLGIKPDTFSKHIEEAKARMSVRTTTELVVRSLFDGQISFKDVIKKTSPPS